LLARGGALFEYGDALRPVCFTPSFSPGIGHPIAKGGGQVIFRCNDWETINGQAV
jgi:hypothetical protein